jgi:catechol 2,3-dioxygenase-like lactoylglutathione lyase family enzyme
MTEISMDIVGLNSVVFAAEDIGAARRFCSDFGLTELEHGEWGAAFEALDGTGVVIRSPGDAALPPANVSGSTARETVWGVSGKSTLRQIGAELTKDRPVREDSAGVLHTVDDDNQGIAFELNRRRPYNAEPYPHNVAGLPEGRVLNERVSFSGKPMARTLGHVVYWTHDAARSMKFYIERLGFRITDSYEGNAGIFARAAGSHEHHNIFFVGQDRFPPSFQHLEFAFGDVQEVMMNGAQLSAKGWTTAMGPGRFTLGSNWYWYFVTPLGGNFEMAADMDRVDDHWKPGVWKPSPEVLGWRLRVNDAPIRF